MSLIADALKAAQREKTQQFPPPPRISAQPRGGGGFFAYSQNSRVKREGLPKGVMYALMGLGSLGLVAALVALLVSTSTPSTTVAAPTPSPISSPTVSTPVPIPSVSQSPDSAAVLAQSAPPLTQSDESFGEPSRSYPVESYPVIVPRPAPQRASSAPLSEAVIEPHTETGAPVEVSVPATQPAARRPSGTLRITMESPVNRDPGPLFQEALAAQRRGDLSSARDLYARALARNPNNAELHNNLGTLYKTAGELDRAEESYRRAIALSPRLAAAWSNLGVLLNSRGRVKEATAALQQALTIDPASAATKVNLGILYQAAGMHVEARRLLEEAVRANPLAAEPHYALAGSLEKLGDRQGAIRQYDLFLATAGTQFAPLQQQVRQHLATLRAQ